MLVYQLRALENLNHQYMLKSKTAYPTGIRTPTTTPGPPLRSRRYRKDKADAILNNSNADTTCMTHKRIY